MEENFSFVVRFFPKTSEEIQRKGEVKHKLRGVVRRRIQRTENGPAVRSAWTWSGLTRHGYYVDVTLPWLFWLLGDVDAIPMYNEDTSGLVVSVVDISLPLVASGAIPGDLVVVPGADYSWCGRPHQE